MRREMDPQSGTNRYSSLFPYWKLGSRMKGKQTLIFEIAVFVDDRNVIHAKAGRKFTSAAKFFLRRLLFREKIQLNSAANLSMKETQASICAISIYSSG